MGEVVGLLGISAKVSENLFRTSLSTVPLNDTQLLFFISLGFWAAAEEALIMMAV